MKNKMFKKLCAGILVSVLTVGTLAGCGSDGSAASGSSETAGSSESAGSSEAEATVDASASTAEEEVAVSYPVEGEDVTLTIATVAPNEATLTMNYRDVAHTPYGEAWMEATGINFEVIMPADNDAMALLMASGEMPDLIWYDWDYYNGGFNKAIKDGVIVPLNDYLEYCPDLMKVLESDDAYYNAVTTSDGLIAGFPFIRGDASIMTSAGLMLREDWLNELELELPETPEDLYNVLVAFKEEKGAEIPFTATPFFLSLAFEQGIVTSPFGLAKCNFYVDDGVVHYGYAEEAYKDVLAYFNKLYTEGLFDPNFASVDVNTTRANMMNGTSGVTVDTGGSGLATSVKSMRETEPTYDLAGFGPLVAQSGDIAMSTHYDSATTGEIMVITSDCDNIEAAAQFVNWCYTEAGCMLNNYGIEGITYTVDDDGKIRLTDYVLNNPDGWTINQVQAGYNRSWSGFPFVQIPRPDSGITLPEQQEAIDRWSTSNAPDYFYPAISVAEEDTSEYSRLMADISTYIAEMQNRYITGVESLDNFETVYLKTLKDMGIDTVIEMKQKAYDVYTNK